jgi:NAD(P)H-nitrite reductase large subunit
LLRAVTMAAATVGYFKSHCTEHLHAWLRTEGISTFYYALKAEDELATHEKRYVIIGNGVAGTTAADTLRKNDPNCSIHLLTNEPYPLYNRVSLPRFLQGVLAEQKVMIRNFEWHEQRNIQLITETLVTCVDTDERVVVTDKGQHLPYDALLIASGGWANPLCVPGASECRHIYNFVTLDDTKTIIARMLESRTAVAYGGSFISYELCDGFAMRKLNTTWLMRGPYWLRNCLDPEGGEVVDNIAKKFGVEVIHGDEIESVVPKNGVPSYIKTKKGREIQADMLGVGLGITLNTQFLAGTPVEIRSGVVVNEYLETNVPGVYAAGDVAEFFDLAVNEHHTMGTWDNALAHGRVVGANMAGGHQPYVDVPTYTSPLFDVNIAVIGTAESNNPELESIARREPGEKGNDNYRKLFFRDNRLVGAIMIGSPKGRKKLVDIVKNQETIESAAEREALLTLR